MVAQGTGTGAGADFAAVGCKNDSFAAVVGTAIVDVAIEYASADLATVDPVAVESAVVESTRDVAGQLGTAT